MPSNYQDPCFDTVFTGQITASGVPTITQNCKMVRFITPSGNSDTPSSRKGNAPGSDSIGSGAAIPMPKGTDTGWMPFSSIRIWNFTITAGDTITYEMGL